MTLLANVHPESEENIDLIKILYSTYYHGKI